MIQFPFEIYSFSLGLNIGLLIGLLVARRIRKRLRKENKVVFTSNILIDRAHG